MMRALRIGLLLFVLLVVAQGAWTARARTTDWKAPLRVVIYPLYPQTKAEIMAGRIPLSAMQTDTPRDLEQVVIGAKTAQEISWLR